MAKKNELVQLKKGEAKFNLVGVAQVKDFTFKIDMESQKSDWIYNQMNLGVNCGEDGVIYAEAMGGYGSERQNQVYVHGKKKNDNDKWIDDFANKFTIDWDDRNEEDILESVGDMCFKTVGLEKDENDKVVYKKFLSEYDFIQYINDNLQDGMVINVKGNLKYSVYEGKQQIKKEITSVYLSKAEEKDYKATFTQTILLDKDSMGKADKETSTIPVTALVIDYVKEYEGKLVKGSIPFMRTFDLSINMEDMEKTKKVLKCFKVSKDITALTVEGKFSKGALNTVEVSEDDIPEDIRDLIELGVIDKDEIIGKMVLANGGGKAPEKMIITNPKIKFVENKELGKKMPQLDKVEKAYTLEDVSLALILEGCEDTQSKSNNKPVDDEEPTEEDLNKALDSESEDGEDDFLSELGL